MTAPEQQPLPPTTTLQQDKTVEGQREINAVWEHTQSKIALSVVVGGTLINSLLILAIVISGLVSQKEITISQLALMSISLQFINFMAGTVVGFYFSRTNHTNIGGTGPKTTDDAEHVGR